MKVRRVYVEKKAGFDVEARRLREELTNFLGPQYPELRRLGRLRVLRRYDALYLTEEQFIRAAAEVFSEPQCDHVYFDGEVPAGEGDRFFGIEYVPGQYDQRADSAEQCVELLCGVKPRVRCADFYVLEQNGGDLTDPCVEGIKQYLINPVDSREAETGLPLSLEDEDPAPEDVATLTGFTGADLGKLAEEYGLAMSPEDMAFCRTYFASLRRDPTLAELRVLDTYWSDHCRHTTFTTVLEEIGGDDGRDPDLAEALALYEETRREVYGGGGGKKRTLMDMAVIGAKALKKRGLCDDVDESGEINACTVRVDAEFSDGSGEPWLLLFKNETHNHPTEIEPFGGAATCLGGAIRDPLSGRAYVHQAMRITGGGDPRTPMKDTLPGKLPQIKIAREAAGGYSSYGNQIGLATGQVAEFYHPGFLAKRMELGAVIGAVPAAWVRREEPQPGDLVILLGGKTGRDGVGGATGSSKAHTGESVTAAAAEVQKGNAVEERKLQRLFRKPEVSALIKRCNDFGAGGVSVAVGELAPGLDIDLDRVPKKYAGLDGTELAISESQERMAVVVAAPDAEAFIGAAAAENLEAVVIAGVTAGGNTAALRMTWRGRTIVELDREFLDSNGAPRSALVRLPPRNGGKGEAPGGNVPAGNAAGTGDPEPGALLNMLEEELKSLRSGSRRGLQERFDGSIGAASVLFPWGGSEQGTPECGMAALLPSLDKTSRTASLMSFGYDPDLMSLDPYRGAKGSIREALTKFACLGGDPFKSRLSLQEYFERPESPEGWGKPAAALLGALEAQLRLGVPAIGGKDSMSGNYRDASRNIRMGVPPTLVAFAAGTAPAAKVRSGALSGVPGNLILLFSQNGDGGAAGTGEWGLFRANMKALETLSAGGLVRAAYPVGPGGAAAALALMAFGGMIGVEAYVPALNKADGEGRQGSFLVEVDEYPGSLPGGEAGGGGGAGGSSPRFFIAGRIIEEKVFRISRDPEAGGGTGSAECPLDLLRRAYESPLAQVYPQTSAEAAAPAAAAQEGADAAPDAEAVWASLPACPGKPAPHSPSLHVPRPLVVLPVFPGTNCEWDTERAFKEAGARTRPVIFRNRNREDIQESIGEFAAAFREAQIIAFAGGFSAGDEPDGSGKFIASVLRSPPVAEALRELLENRDGLVLGICNGFQALIKLGLVPYGSIRSAGSFMPTLTFNRIGRHVSRMVRTRVMAARSPWLSLEEEGTIHTIPVSHGEGRIAIGEQEARELFARGQVPFCYADSLGRPAMTEPDNPNGSAFAIEGLTSPDGRILGKMGHSERRGDLVHINIPGNKRQRIFEAGVRYFS